MTRFVVGGVYTRPIGTHSVSTGVIVGATKHGSGRQGGVMYSEGFAPISVIEGSQSLEEWTLQMEPVSSEMLRELEQSYFHKLEALEARILALEAAAGESAEPEEDSKSDGSDPLNNLLQVTGRAKPQKAART